MNPMRAQDGEGVPSTVLTVEARIPGSRATRAPLEVSLPPHTGEHGLPLRDLLEHVVRAEVQAFQGREHERRLSRVFSPAMIAEAAGAGKVAPGAAEGPAAQVDPDAAVVRALEAFGDGLYVVFVDGAQVESLESEVTLHPGSRVQFIRLVALAGG